MPTTTDYDAGAPTIEVRVFRDDELLTRELFETEDEAQAAAARWQEQEGITVTVDDLSFHHGPEDILSPEPVPPLEEEGPGPEPAPEETGAGR